MDGLGQEHEHLECAHCRNHYVGSIRLCYLSKKGTKSEYGLPQAVVVSSFLYQLSKSSGRFDQNDL